MLSRSSGDRFTVVEEDYSYGDEDPANSRPLTPVNNMSISSSPGHSRRSSLSLDSPIRSRASSFYDPEAEDEDDLLMRWMEGEPSDPPGGVTRTNSPSMQGSTNGEYYYDDSDSGSNTTVSGNDIANLEKDWKIGCCTRNLAHIAYARWRFQAKLADRPGLAVAVTAASAALAYLYLMMLRFPMLAGTIDQEAGRPFKSINISWKSTKIIAFGIGYTAGKIPSVFLVGRLRPWQRLKVMLFIVSFGFVTIVGFFQIADPEIEAILLIIGAFVMASFFGIISQYLEGRQFTEVMISALSASMMLGDPLARYLATLMIENHVPLHHIPIILGAAFFAPCVLAMLCLDTVPPPTRVDAFVKAERRPLSFNKGKRFVSEYLFGIICSIIAYTFVCALRNYREYFAADIYTHALQRELLSWHFLVLEVPSSVIVFIAISVLSRIKDNKKGFFAVLGVVAIGAILILVITYCYQSNYLGDPTTSGVVWIECIATGTYLMYIPVGFLLFDRLVASTKFTGTAAVFINIADVFGQAASVGVVSYREIDDMHKGASANGKNSEELHEFYVGLIYPMVGVILIMITITALYFWVKLEDTEPIIPRRRSSVLNIQGDENDYEETEPFLNINGTGSNQGVVDKCATSTKTRTTMRPRSRGRSVSPQRPRSATVEEVEYASPTTLFFECDECHARFSGATALLIHRRNVHLSHPAWHKEPIQIKTKIMALVEDIRNFTRKLPSNKQVAEFEPDLFMQCARSTMDAQPKLSEVYKECVPSKISDKVFWSNYAFRINCIREAFYSLAQGSKFRHQFESDSEYGAYVQKALATPGTRVVVRESFIDVEEGDFGTFISNDEPYSPPAQVRVDRVNGLRFFLWHQLELAAKEPKYPIGDVESEQWGGAAASDSATANIYE